MHEDSIEVEFSEGILFTSDYLLGENKKERDGRDSAKSNWYFHQDMENLIEEINQQGRHGKV